MTIIISAIIFYYSFICILQYIFYYKYKKFFDKGNPNVDRKFVVCIPCHDSYEDLRNILSELSAQNENHCILDVVVVLDNCTDDFNLSEFPRVKFVKRIDQNNIGKVFALNYGTKFIMKSYPNLDFFIVFIDCDVRIEKNFFETLSSSIIDNKTIIQPFITLFTEDEDLSFKLKKFNYAQRMVKCVGQSGLNIFCGLTGPLMCMHYSVLNTIDWESIINLNIKQNEDIAFGFLLASYNIRIKTIKKLNCYAHEQNDRTVHKRQMSRWFSGKMDRLTKLFPYLGGSIVKDFDLYKLYALHELALFSSLDVYLFSLLFTLLIFIVDIDFIVKVIWISIVIFYYGYWLILLNELKILDIKEFFYGGGLYLMTRIRTYLKYFLLKKDNW